MPVHQLCESAIRALSSSQVVTSVSSVVKELLENALDAGALSVDVKLENFGLDKIEVRDNGCGISAEDIDHIAQHHCTSKLLSLDDLNTLTTYGFRGEALASLCALADVTVTTKTTNDDVGAMFAFDNSGSIVRSEPSHLPTGTTVTAIGLFKNFPVRRNYYASSLKRCRTELQDVTNYLVAFALVRPLVRLTLRHNKEIVWTKVAASDVRQALMSVIGNPAVASMRQVQKCYDSPPWHLEAFLPLPGTVGLGACRTSADHQFVYVNNRPVTMPSVTKLLRDYHSRSLADGDCAANKFPIVFLHITVPPSSVDVNLEPNKTRVLLHSQVDIMAALDDVFQEVYCEKLALRNPEPAAPLSNAETPASSREDPSRDQDDEVECGSSRSTSTLTPIVDGNEHLANDGKHEEKDQAATPASYKPIVGEQLINDVEFVDMDLSDLLRDDDDDDDDDDDIMAQSSPSPSDDKENGQPKVAGTIMDWSRGEAVVDSAGQRVEPVRLLTTDSVANRNASVAEQTAFDRLLNATRNNSEKVFDQEQSGKLKAADDNNHPSSKKKRKSEVDSEVVVNGTKSTSKKSCSDSTKGFHGFQSQCIEKLFKCHRQTSLSTRQRSVQVPFSLSAVQQALGCQVDNDTSTTENGVTSPSEERLRTIGQLKSHGVWTCLRGRREVVLFHFIRAREQMMYLKMMSNHTLPAERLDQPVTIDTRLLGNVECYKLLLSMNKTTPTPTEPRRTFTDERLVKNGFVICELPGACSDDAPTLQIVSMAKCIGFYGLLDLNEILSAVLRTKSDEQFDVANCRPIKVKHYLQAEATRLARRLTGDVTQLEVDELLSELNRMPYASVVRCFHNRPIIVHLHSICRQELTPTTTNAVNENNTDRNDQSQCKELVSSGDC